MIKGNLKEIGFFMFRDQHSNTDNFYSNLPSEPLLVLAFEDSEKNVFTWLLYSTIQLDMCLFSFKNAISKDLRRRIRERLDKDLFPTVSPRTKSTYIGLKAETTFELAKKAYKNKLSRLDIPNQKSPILCIDEILEDYPGNYGSH